MFLIWEVENIERQNHRMTDFFIFIFILVSSDEHFATEDDLRSFHRHLCPGH